MALQLGIVGLPNAGKSTLFTALTRSRVEIAVYPFTTVDPNVGVVPVPDPRLDVIAGITKPKRVVPATIQFVDIAGLVRGAHRGEGLGNQFLAHIREVDVIVHVVRCFPIGEIPHVMGEVDPIRDIEVVNTELALADLGSVERAKEKALSRAKAGDRKASEEVALFEKLIKVLNQGQPVRMLELTQEERKIVDSLKLLTAKPMVYVANVDEGGLNGSSWAAAVHRKAEQEGAQAVTICAKLEAELAELPEEEARQFLQELGVEEAGLVRLIHVGYKLLNLVTFFTTASQEVRAWPIPRGTLAPQAAGRIHSDMERGFIRAEVVHFADLVAAGSIERAREHGLVHLVGKDYIVQDGDIIYFRFAV